MTEPEIIVAPDASALSTFAANEVVATLRRNPGAAISLPTGSTPEGMYAEITRRARNGEVDLSRVQLYCMDEYLGKTGADDNSLTSLLLKHFVIPAGIPLQNFHTLPTLDLDALAAAKRYESEIANAGGLDLVVLGIGANGHIAYNEPGSVAGSRTRVINLTPESLAQADDYFAGMPVPDRAMTIGVGTLLEAKRIVLIASGAGKAEIMRQALREPMSADVPASWLRLAPQKVTVIVDEPAAALL